MWDCWWHWSLDPKERCHPTTTDCQHRDHGKAAASLPPKSVLCVSCCQSWSLLLAFPLPKGIRVSSVPCVRMCFLCPCEFPRCLQMFYFIAALPCLAPHPVMGTFLDQRCLLLSEWFPFPAVHSQYILLLSHIAAPLSSRPALAAVCLRDIPLLKHHLRFSLAEIMWGSCRSLPLSTPCAYQLYINLLQLLHHGCMNEVVF